jgi:hypothetical protein
MTGMSEPESLKSWAKLHQQMDKLIALLSALPSPPQPEQREDEWISACGNFPKHPTPPIPAPGEAALKEKGEGLAVTPECNLWAPIGPSLINGSTPSPESQAPKIEDRERENAELHATIVAKDAELKQMQERIEREREYHSATSNVLIAAKATIAAKDAEIVELKRLRQHNLKGVIMEADELREANQRLREALEKILADWCEYEHQDIGDVCRTALHQE